MPSTPPSHRLERPTLSPNPGTPTRPATSRKFARGSVLLTGLLAAFASRGALERTGPIDPANGFPAWYQDKTGLTLELMTPLNPSELAGAWTMLLAGNTVAPESFPGQFFPEHFYWAGTSEVVNYSLPANLGGGTQQALLVLALEAGFTGGNVVAGTQMTFARIRIQMDKIPYSGDYVIFTPYGDFFFPNQLAGNRLRFTQDIGLNPGDFNAPLSAPLGPFLVPSLTPGGAETPALTATNPQPDQDPTHFKGVFTPTPYPGTGKSYLADPARVGPVTGSPLPSFTRGDGTVANHNLFRIEGPVIPGTTNRFALETQNFALAGRVFTGPIPGRVDVTRATYTDDGATDRRLDVFATATGGTSGRLPGSPRPPTTIPSLWVYPAPPATDPATGAVLTPLAAPAGITPLPLLKSGNNYWSQIAFPAGVPFPSSVTVADASALDAQGNRIAAFFQRRVTDLVTITAASYSPANGGTLTVSAQSSDKVAGGPQLTLDGFKDLAAGQIIISPLSAGPGRISVTSFAGGVAQVEVITAPGMPYDPGSQPPQAPAPVANNDSFALLEDNLVPSLNVLANDALNGTGTLVVTVLSSPKLGTVTVNADNTLRYAPKLNANGSDSLTYKVTVGGLDSNIGTVNFFVMPVNDLPVASNDTVLGIVGVPLPIFPLLNDTDPDGASDLNSVIVVTPPAGATASTGLGGVINFTATKPGVYSFTYKAVDLSGAASATAATVSVTVNDVVKVTAATLTTSRNLWAITGTAYAGSVITLIATDAAGTKVASLGTATTDAKGAWKASPTLAVPATATTVVATSSNRGVDQLPILRK